MAFPSAELVGIGEALLQKCGREMDQRFGDLHFLRQGGAEQV